MIKYIGVTIIMIMGNVCGVGTMWPHGGVYSMGGRVAGLAANVVNALHGMHTGIHPVVDER